MATMLEFTERLLAATKRFVGDAHDDAMRKLDVRAAALEAADATTLDLVAELEKRVAMLEAKLSK